MQPAAPHETRQVFDCAVPTGIIELCIGSTEPSSALAVGFRWSAMPFETIYTDEMVAVCNGGEGSLGHPRVYLNLEPSGRIECPYCSRLFVNRAAAAAGPGAIPASSGQSGTTSE